MVFVVKINLGSKGFRTGNELSVELEALAEIVAEGGNKPFDVTIGGEIRDIDGVVQGAYYVDELNLGAPRDDFDNEPLAKVCGNTASAEEIGAYA